LLLAAHVGGARGGECRDHEIAGLVLGGGAGGGADLVGGEGLGERHGAGDDGGLGVPKTDAGALRRIFLLPSTIKRTGWTVSPGSTGVPSAYVDATTEGTECDDIRDGEGGTAHEETGLCSCIIN
jgi:hypothetical protein